MLRLLIRIKPGPPDVLKGILVGKMFNLDKCRQQDSVQADVLKIIFVGKAFNLDKCRQQDLYKLMYTWRFSSARCSVPTYAVNRNLCRPMCCADVLARLTGFRTSCTGSSAGS